MSGIEEFVLKKLYLEEKKSVKEISDKLNICASQVNVYIRKYGIPRRPRTGWNKGLTKETDERIIISDKKRMESRVYVKGEEHHLYNKPKSEETKRKISVSHLGLKNPHTKEWNEKISVALTGIKRGPHKLEHIKKIAIASKKKWQEEEYRNKLLPILEIWRNSKNHHDNMPRGSNHYNWNNNISEEKRYNRKKSEEWNLWRNEIFLRDNYTCQYCGNRSCENNQVYLEPHHLEGYHWCEELRYDISNGITLCKPCHKEFHKVYGTHWNTTEQFIEWRNIHD